MTEEFHYPPDLFDLLVDSIAYLNKSKKGVVLFLRGSGVHESDLLEVEALVRTKAGAATINKFEIARNVLKKVNARGDTGLRPRREIIKRVVEFEEFSTSCWPADQLKAKGLVASVRDAVRKKDAFTRMQQERDTEHAETMARRRAEQADAAEKRTRIESLSSRLATLFAMDDRPHERGLALEKVLNDLFRAYNVLIHENFRRKAPDTPLVLEQIDGVVDLDGIHLVEMKWLKEPVGTSEFSPHAIRLFTRANACGIFISNSGYTESVVRECTSLLSQRTMILCSLHEVVLLLHRGDDLIRFLKQKRHAAIVDKNPFLQILS
jgi:hypothetical protein